MNALISILGEARVSGESESMELTTVGTVEAIDGGFLIRYEETADGQPTGLGNVTTTMRVTPPLLELERTGEISSLLLLEYGKRHICSYTTPYGQLQMGIYTKRLHTALTPDGHGTLELEYSLDVAGGGASEHSIHLHIKPLS